MWPESAEGLSMRNRALVSLGKHRGNSACDDAQVVVSQVVGKILNFLGLLRVSSRKTTQVIKKKKTSHTPCIEFTRAEYERR